MDRAAARARHAERAQRATRSVHEPSPRDRHASRPRRLTNDMMETLGAILGKKPEALRQRHHRGRLKCILHEGLLYYPTAGIVEELAASLSDAKLGELLGVHRNTVGALRRAAPAGMSAVEMAQYLWHRVKRE